MAMFSDVKCNCSCAEAMARLGKLENELRMRQRWDEEVHRLAEKVSDLHQRIRGVGERAGLEEAVEALCRFMGGNIVVKREGRTVTFQKL